MSSRSRAYKVYVGGLLGGVVIFPVLRTVSSWAEHESLSLADSRSSRAITVVLVVLLGACLPRGLHWLAPSPERMFIGVDHATPRFTHFVRRAGLRAAVCSGAASALFAAAVSHGLHLGILEGARLVAFCGCLTLFFLLAGTARRLVRAPQTGLGQRSRPRARLVVRLAAGFLLALAVLQPLWLSVLSLCLLYSLLLIGLVDLLRSYGYSALRHDSEARQKLLAAAVLGDLGSVPPRGTGGSWPERMRPRLRRFDTRALALSPLCRPGIAVVAVLVSALAGWSAANGSADALFGFVAVTALVLGMPPITRGAFDLESAFRTTMLPQVMKRRRLAATYLVALTIPFTTYSAGVCLGAAHGGGLSVPVLIHNWGVWAVSTLIGVALARAGALPSALMGPVPTPFGDVSSLLALAWLARGLIPGLIVVVCGGAGPGLGALIVCAATCALLMLAGEIVRGRVRRPHKSTVN